MMPMAGGPEPDLSEDFRWRLLEERNRRLEDIVHQQLHGVAAGYAEFVRLYRALHQVNPDPKNVAPEPCEDDDLLGCEP